MGQQIQVVDAEGQYQAGSVEQFVDGRSLSSAGIKYITVAIMGPQSSGKSTLLNALVRNSLDDCNVSILCGRFVWQRCHQGRLDSNIDIAGALACTLVSLRAALDERCMRCVQFGTDFKEMDAQAGRKQTTRGIWLDLSLKVTEMPTLVMDLEGSDGRERGEDDTTFERQSALFALATSDVLMINMFAVNIGRVQGSGAPLLKTIFQV